jgi:hypothetical protein
MSELWKRNPSVPYFSRCKIKSFIFIVIFSINVLGLYAEAPELRNVMPNSWKKLTRLTEAAEKNFFTVNVSLMNKILNIAQNEFWIDDDFQNLSPYRRVYEEKAGSDTFYRIIFAESESYQYEALGYKFLQVLAYKTNTTCILISMGIYNRIDVTERGTFAVYPSIDIIQVGGKAKAVLYTSLRVRIDEKREEKTVRVLRISSVGETDAYYHFMSDFSENTEFFMLGGSMVIVPRLSYERIHIYASDCLVDPKSPLRYSLQNAFDGDPSTSYVENTKDNLMKINLEYANFQEITRIAIINGYAQDMDLYTKNNRVKEINIESLTERGRISLGKRLCKDNTLNYQFFDIKEPSSLYITDIFRSTAYNDTCIAELNFKTKDGWLFGGIDE